MGVVGLVVVARGNEDPVSRLGRVDRRLDGGVLPGLALVRADEQDGEEVVEQSASAEPASTRAASAAKTPTAVRVDLARSAIIDVPPNTACWPDCLAPRGRTQNYLLTQGLWHVSL